MAAGSFFERLEPAPAERQRTRKQPDTAKQVAMIKRQLDILLNARQGASASTPDYGLTDFNDAAVSTADMTLKIIDDIKQTIRRYEPRVSVDTVICERNPDYPMELTFRIIGYLSADTAQERLEIDLVMSGLDRYNKILK